MHAELTDTATEGHPASVISVEPSDGLAEATVQDALSALGLHAATVRGDALWWQGPTLRVPNEQWTPVPWTTVYSGAEWHDGFTAETTVTADSHNQALPQSTIHVVSTAGFWVPTPTVPGYAMVRVLASPPEWTVIRYTGMTATTLTGCTLGTGTLHTGRMVRPAPVHLIYETDDQDRGDFFSQVANLRWEGNATGVRSSRWRLEDASFPLEIYANDDPGLNLARGQMTQLSGEPAGGLGAPHRDILEVWQSSGGVLKLLNTGIDAPILMMTRHAKVHAI